MTARQRQVAVAAGTVIALVLAGAVLRFAVFTPSSAKAGGTVLSLISPEVLVLRLGAAVPITARDGEALSEGDRVMTRASGRAVITFFDGSTQTIEPNTVITLRRLASNSGGGFLATVRQTVGTTWTTVFSVSDGGAGVQVESPAATAAVRDTMFHVQVMPGGKTSVWTRQGTVAVNVRGHEQDVTADKKLIVGPGTGSLLPVVEPAPVDEVKLTLDGAGWMLVRDPNGYSSGLVPPGAPVNQIPLAVIHDPSVRPQSVSLGSLVDGTYNVYLSTGAEVSFRLSADDGRSWATRCLRTASGSIQPDETWLVKMKLDVVEGELVGCTLSDPEITRDDPYSKIRVARPLIDALLAGRLVIPEFGVLAASASRPQASATAPGGSNATAESAVTAASHAGPEPPPPASTIVPVATEAPPLPTQTPVAPNATATAVPTNSSAPPPAATDVPPATVPPSATDTPVPTVAPPAPTATPPSPTAMPTFTPSASPTPVPTATPSGPCAPAWADVNGDGAVSETDVTLVTSWFGQTSPPASAAYDVNGDHQITISDIQLVQAYVGLIVCP
ncbi:MAG: hypothetical protein EPO22_12300 [Dehalococcoidia bacterium]|nr:MAG: hypothetical protein EPO22_12300 [Dehalococcoidia bacterium]